VLAADGEFALATVADTRTALVGIAAALKAGAKRAAIKPQRPAMALPARQAGIFHPSRAIHALLKAFPGAIWVDESGLSTSDVRQWMTLKAGEYFINGSGGIGWGLAASVGAALGNPDRQVVAVIGDGSALYASEALWTAAHHQTNLLLVVLSNRRYATLNEAASRLTGKALDLFTIEPPVIDFSGLAALYRWRYVRAAAETDLTAFLGKTRGRVAQNTLLDIQLDPKVKPVTASRHF
jgi:benzoylformate decarboxylase